MQAGYPASLTGEVNEQQSFNSHSRSDRLAAGSLPARGGTYLAFTDSSAAPADILLAIIPNDHPASSRDDCTPAHRHTRANLHRP